MKLFIQIYTNTRFPEMRDLYYSSVKVVYIYNWRTCTVKYNTNTATALQ